MADAIMRDVLNIDWGNDGLCRLAMVLADYASADGSGVWASVDTLARRVFREKRTVQRHLRTLREAGVIFEVPSHHKSTCYQISLNVVRLLRRGVVTLAELISGSVLVEPEADDPQLSLPGLEREGEAKASPGQSFTDGATELSRGGDRTVTQTDKNKTIPGARARDDDLVLEKLKGAAGEALNEQEGYALREMSEVRNWLEAGADMELDILPTIAARSQGKQAGSVYSWKYYRAAVLSALARRTEVVDLEQYRQRRAGRPHGGAQGAAGIGDVDDIRARNYRAALELFEETGFWDYAMGPRPDEAGLAVGAAH